MKEFFKNDSSAKNVFNDLNVYKTLKANKSFLCKILIQHDSQFFGKIYISTFLSNHNSNIFGLNFIKQYVYHILLQNYFMVTESRSLL